MEGGGGTNVEEGLDAFGVLGGLGQCQYGKGYVVLFRCLPFWVFLKVLGVGE